MDGVTRIGVSLEPELLKAFDESISKKGYVSRSEAIRDLVRDSLAENEWKNEDEWMVGTIVMVYDTSTWTTTSAWRSSSARAGSGTSRRSPTRSPP